MSDIFGRTLERRYDYGASANYMRSLNAIPMVEEIVKSAPFRRLKHIRFLGAIDYFIIYSPNGYNGNKRYSRYQHSLGVAYLALIYSNIVGLSPERRNGALAAALLHDIGHFPLSHSLESLFSERFGINHHAQTKSIIRGEKFSREIPKILKRYNVDLDYVIELIEGRSPDFSSLFSGPINLDTIEGISRSSLYAGRRPASHSPERVLFAAINRDRFSSQRAVDAFWHLKDKVYSVIINSPNGVIADFLSRVHAEESLFSLDGRITYATENVLFKRVPSLRNALRGRDLSKLRLMGHDSIGYQARRFLIDDSIHFESLRDRERYRQTKTFKSISLNSYLREFDEEVRPQWLFGDGVSR